ncbi:hypothetical protein ACFV0A_05040, partial [Streptomyces sp. NPDC059552]
MRPTIRIRLTLLYGGMFLIAGILLLSIIYLLAAQALRQGNALPFQIVGGQVKVSSTNCSGVMGGPLEPEQFNAAVNQCVLEQRRHALDDLLSRSLMALLGLSIIAFAFGYAMAGGGGGGRGPDTPRAPPAGGRRAGARGRGARARGG